MLSLTEPDLIKKNAPGELYTQCVLLSILFSKNKMEYGSFRVFLKDGTLYAPLAADVIVAYNQSLTHKNLDRGFPALLEQRQEAAGNDLAVYFDLANSGLHTVGIADSDHIFRAAEETANREFLPLRRNDRVDPQTVQLGLHSENAL